MKLININENVPDEFFIFVNFQNIQTRHNVEKTKCIFSSAFLQYIEEVDKSFASKHLKGVITAFDPINAGKKNFAAKYINGKVNYLPFSYNWDSDIDFISMFNHNITNEYQTEYNCELHRYYNFPKYPSRLSSCYAFGDYESCKLVSQKYGWKLDTIRKFKLIPHEKNRVAKVNMEIISLQRLANNISMQDITTLNQVWSWYWNGNGELELELPGHSGLRHIYKSGEIWEYLVEGILEIVE